MIRQYLDDLERRIDPETEDRLLSEWLGFTAGNVKSGIFSPKRAQKVPAGLPWPWASVNQALDDRDAMVLQQLASCSAALADGSGSLMNIRSNFGTGIMSSLFGAPVFRMDDNLDTLPTTMPLEGGAEAIQRLVDRGVPDIFGGYGTKCFEMGRYYVELFRDYPKIANYVRVYHPDLQGPVDIAELVWGSAIFLDLFDVPELVHSFLALITETYTSFMREWEKIIPLAGGHAVHWGMMHRGRIMLRDDSAMNLSPEMFEEFIKPYDQRLLSEFGGGAIHFCGRGDHYIEPLSGMDKIYAINLSQPQYNDMERIFANTVDKGIVIVGLNRKAAETALSAGRDLHGLVHCW